MLAFFRCRTMDVFDLRERMLHYYMYNGNEVVSCPFILLSLVKSTHIHSLLFNFSLMFQNVNLRVPSVTGVIGNSFGI